MQVVTPVGQAAYAFVFKAQAPMQAGKEPQFSLTLIFKKGTDLKKMEKAISEVAKAKFGPKADQMLAKGQLKNPLRDGNVDRSEDEAFKDAKFLTARSNEKPGVVDGSAEPLMNQSDFYSGCQARADVWFYAFEKAGNKGVAAILNNCQKVEDGERMSGRRSAEEAFKDESLL